MANIFCESFVQRFCFFFKHAGRNVDAGIAKLGKSLATDLADSGPAWKRPRGRSGGNDGIRARCSASLMGARLQVDIESCATRFFSGLLDGEDFGMFHAIVGVATVADD